jgi:hypothetical protein
MMAKKSKTLCKWDRDEIEKDLEELRKIVFDPRFVCRRCGRAVAKKKSVCKPISLVDGS